MKDLEEGEYMRILQIAKNDPDPILLEPNKEEYKEKLRILIKPESDRQLNLIREAISRTIDVVYE